MLKLVYFTIIAIIFMIETITKKRISKLSSILLMIYLIILMGGSTENPDSVIYQNIFYRDMFTKDIGFGFLINICKSLGFGLNEFRLIVAILGFLLINYTVSKFVKDKTYFYILYAIYPFLFDVVQVRNFLAMSLFIFAIPYLLEEKKRKRIVYVIIIILAATIQKVALVYIPIVFIKNLENKKIVRRILYCCIVGSVFLGLFKNSLYSFSNLILAPLSEELNGLSNYLNRNTNFGWVVFWLEQMINFLLIRWAKNIICKRMEDKRLHKAFNYSIINFSKLIYDINLYMFIFLPLFVLDENFTRIIRNVMPLNLMVYVITYSILIYNIRFKRKQYNRVKAIVFLGATMSYQLVLFILLSRSYWETIVIPIFEKSWIW